MSKTTRDLKKRMKAPKNLVEAVKKGERLEPVGVVNTRAVHIQRFTKAIAAYACVAAVLIATAFVLPALLDYGEVQPSTTGSNPTEELNQPNDYQYVYPPVDEAHNYLRPELIWVNHLNPTLVDTIIWTMQIDGGEGRVVYPYTIPAFGGEDAQFAVELRFERVSGDVKWPHENDFLPQIEKIEQMLAEFGFEEIDKRNEESNDLLYGKKYYAANRAQMEAVDVQKLEEACKFSTEGIRIVMKLAWQGSFYAGDCEIIQNQPLSSASQVVTADTSLLPKESEGVAWELRLNESPSAMADEKKATVIAKKISSVSYYHTYNFAYVTPCVYTVSTFEILSVEKGTDYYYKGTEEKSFENPYQVGNTIQVIEWYGFVPDAGDPNELVLYRSYPYPTRGVEMPELAELEETYRLTLIDGSALMNYDNIVAANCYDTSDGAEFGRSGVMYLANVHLVADLEKIG
ncbi:MAG: hypothetical protein J6R82_06615 [Clostridia bacterium]|nr:hypothetical protein [Clostridia bacterium]